MHDWCDLPCRHGGGGHYSGGGGHYHSGGHGGHGCVGSSVLKRCSVLKSMALLLIAPWSFFAAYQRLSRLWKLLCHL